MVPLALMEELVRTPLEVTVVVVVVQDTLEQRALQVRSGTHLSVDFIFLKVA